MKPESRDGIHSISRRAILVCASACFAQASPVVIYAEEDWYRDRAEPEQQWSGILRKREPDPGPSARQALLFTLESGDRRLLIYAAGVTAKLAPFSGRRVTARAKLVDLRSEGYGLELWIATIQTAR